MALTYLYRSPNDLRLDMLQDLSRLIQEYTSVPPYDSKPVVGECAYKHKAGTHLAAILRNPAAYEPIPPRIVGNQRRIVFGELAGKTGAAYLMALLGLEKSESGAREVAAGLKDLRMGDMIDIPLEDRLEKKIINAPMGDVIDIPLEDRLEKKIINAPMELTKILREIWLEDGLEKKIINARMGDMIDIPLEDRLEKKITNAPMELTKILREIWLEDGLEKKIINADYGQGEGSILYDTVDNWKKVINANNGQEKEVIK